jgi:hypothetical protein
VWKEYVSSFSKDYQFEEPVTEAEILSIKEELFVELPKVLVALYQETNGIYGVYGTSLIWSTKQILKENKFFWSLHENRDFIKPLNDFLFFSDAGNGDLFGFKISNGNIQSEEIYVWNHEDDSRSIISASLEEFVKGWMNGEISV